MDSSEQYIKMCEKAEEIQDKWKPTEADFMFNTATRKPCFIRVDRITDKRRKGHNISYKEDRFIWLPRQDQLQGMIKVDLLPELISVFESFAMGYDYFKGRTTAFVFTSMEQLWLAFVMSENFNKQWDGVEWK